MQSPHHRNRHDPHATIRNNIQHRIRDRVALPIPTRPALARPRRLQGRALEESQKEQDNPVEKNSSSRGPEELGESGGYENAFIQEEEGEFDG